MEDKLRELEQKVALLAQDVIVLSNMLRIEMGPDKFAALQSAIVGEFRRQASEQPDEEPLVKSTAG